MTDRLDHLVVRLAAEPCDRSLDQFEAEVARSVAHRREDNRAAAALAPVRVASIGLALAMGVTAGGVAAASAVSEPHPFSTFSVHPELALSTLLAGRK